MKRDRQFNYIMAALSLVVVALCFFGVFGDASYAVTLAAFVPCSASLAGNIAGDCASPRVKGYEQLGIIVNWDDIDFTALAYDSSNPRRVKTFALKSGKKPFALYQNKNNPANFSGTSTTYNQDTDYYDKTLQFYYEGIGGEDAANVVEPLKGGNYVAIVPRKDHRGDGSFQVFGLQSGLKATAQVQDEETGYWLITMNGSEPSAEVSFFDTDYATTKTAYDALVAQIQ